MAATITQDDVKVYEVVVAAFQWGRDPNTQVWYRGEVLYSADLNPILEKRLTSTNSVTTRRTITHNGYLKEKAAQPINAN